MPGTTERPKKIMPPLPEIDDATRTEFLIGAAGLLVLVPYGCGNDGEGGGDESGGTRTVEHWAGTTEVPVEPSRIVTLSSIYAANLISVGLTPAAAGNDIDVQLGEVEELLPDGFDLNEIERIGDDYEPNLEAIAAVEPDLIVGDEFHQEIYDQLSEIAPTVLVEYISNGGWRERFLAVAEAIGRSERAEEVEAEYERVLSELPEELRETTVAFIRPSDGQFLIDSTGTAFPGSVAEDAVIPILDAPEGVGKIDEGSGFVSLSGERLGVVEEADLIVVPDFRSLGEDETSIAQFERNALWETLPAVQAGRVLQVAGLVYSRWRGWSTTAATTTPRSFCCARFMTRWHSVQSERRDEEQTYEPLKIAPVPKTIPSPVHRRRPLRRRCDGDESPRTLAYP